MSFVNEYSQVLKNGILTEPTIQPAATLNGDGINVSPAKKSPIDLRERRRFARRIIKSVQPQLELAARAEAEISGRPFQELLQEAEQIFERCLAAEAPINIDEGKQFPEEVDHEQEPLDDAESHDTDGAKPKDSLKTSRTNGSSDSIEVEMPDIDAPGEVVEEEETTVIVAEPVSSIGSPLSALVEYDDDMLPAKQLTNGNMSHDTKQPKANGFTPGTTHVTPPTPPVSTNETSETVDVLVQGGVPWHLKEFEPEGTSLLNKLDVYQDLGNVDDASIDEDEVMGGDEAASAVTISTPAAKKSKAKSKKKAKSRR